PQCAGICLEITNKTPPDTMCSSLCVLGGKVSGTDDCGGLDKGLCFYMPQGSGPGDAGFCAPACSAQDECQKPALCCPSVLGVPGPGVQTGYCFGAVSCPKGQSDCGPNYTCTMMMYGPFCLDPAFPMHGGAGGAGGGGTGGASAGATGAATSGATGGAAS